MLQKWMYKAGVKPSYTVRKIDATTLIKHVACFNELIYLETTQYRTMLVTSSY